MIQRKCSCGGTCDHCREEEGKPRLQRTAKPGASAPDAPAGEPAAPYGLVGDDGDVVAPGQVRLQADAAHACGHEYRIATNNPATLGHLRELLGDIVDPDQIEYVELRWP